jgi:hypothetical protein
MTGRPAGDHCLPSSSVIQLDALSVAAPVTVIGGEADQVVAPELC